MAAVRSKRPRSFKKPEDPCRCDQSARIPVTLVSLECGDIAWKKSYDSYNCPKHGNGIKHESDAWTFCYECKGLIDAD